MLSSPLRLLITFVVYLATVVAHGEESSYGLVNISAASLRTAPAHSAEMDTQATYGTPVKILKPGETWTLVMLPDSVVSYMHNTAFVTKSEQEMDQWRGGKRLIVTGLEPAVIVADTLCDYPRNIVSDVTLNAIFEGEKKPGAAYARLTFPDGRQGFIRSEMVEDFESWARREPSADRVLDVAYSMMGTPYLWGGATTKAADCSGFTQLAYFAAGVILPRNSSRQAVTGCPVQDFTNPDSLKRGDLLFFGEGDGTKVTHVAVYDRDTLFVHDSGAVFVASFDPANPCYIPRRVLSAVRILGTEQFAPRRIADHPWYF